MDENSVVHSPLSTWSDCLKELHIPNHIELRKRYADSDNRPDTVVTDLAHYTNYEIDVSMAHSHSFD